MAFTGLGVVFAWMTHGAALHTWTLPLVAVTIVYVAYLRHRFNRWRGISDTYAAARDSTLLATRTATATRRVASGARQARRMDGPAAQRQVGVATRADAAWRVAAPAASKKLAERADAGKTLGRVTSALATPSGEVMRVLLPRGVHASTLDRDAIASALDAVAAVVSVGDTAREAVIRLRRFDTLGTPIPRPPRRFVAAATNPHGWSPIAYLGVDEDGREVTFDFGAAHGILAGASRSGKSAALHGMIGDFAANPDTGLYLWDGKGGAELGAWRAHAAFFHDGNGIGLDGILRVQSMIAARFARLEEERRENAAGDYGAYPPVLVVVDEVGAYAAQGREAKKFLDIVRDVMMRGLAVNVTVILASQKPTGDAVPSALSALAENRMAFKCGTRQMAASAIGDDAAMYAVDDLPKPESSPEGRRRTAGRFVVATHGVTFGRTYLVDPRTLAAEAPDRSAASLAEHPPEGGEARARRADVREDARMRDGDDGVVIDVDVISVDDAPLGLPAPAASTPAASERPAASGLGVGPWMPRHAGERRAAWRRRRAAAWAEWPERCARWAARR